MPILGYTKNRYFDIAFLITQQMIQLVSRKFMSYSKDCMFNVAKKQKFCIFLSKKILSKH